MTRPNSRVIEVAIETALRSPCQKSRRGVVIYTDGAIIGTGFNGPPEPGLCGVDQPCGGGMIKKGDLSACSMVCMHAEARAIAAAQHGFAARGVPCWGVHVAVNAAGLLITGGGPSCWQCSKLVLEAGLERFWLYERDERDAPVWRAYTAEEFHRQTLIACDLLGPPHHEYATASLPPRAAARTDRAVALVSDEAIDDGQRANLVLREVLAANAANEPNILSRSHRHFADDLMRSPRCGKCGGPMDPDDDCQRCYPRNG